MTSQPKKWTKEELQTYILLVCANADGSVDDKELELIKSKTSFETFERMHEEFQGDSEEASLKKIDESIQVHHYSQMELAEFRREVYEVFFADCTFERMEKNLDRILDNILY